VEFRGIVADVLTGINEMFHSLSCERLIPCNCQACKNVDDPAFFEFSDLKNRREKGKPTIECRKSFEDVPVLPLLEGFDSKDKDARSHDPPVSEIVSVFRFELN
jgi:hypothetical protein